MDKVIKICSECGRKLPATTEFFHRDKTHSDGLKTKCKECRVKIMINYQKDNKEKAKINRENYYKRNKNRIDARGQAYRDSHRKELNEKSKQYRENNKAKRKETCKKYYAANRDKIIKHKRL